MFPSGQTPRRPRNPRRRKQLPSFKTLCGTSTYEFYSEDPGSNYAQARYLCYYLQQQGLLREYYRQFRRNVRTDPTGYETLKSILEIKDEEGMAKFERSVESLGVEAAVSVNNWPFCSAPGQFHTGDASW